MNLRSIMFADSAACPPASLLYSIFQVQYRCLPSARRVLGPCIVLLPSQVASYMRAVLRTLAQCHAHKILHRDIKPGNFMLLSDADNAPVKAIGRQAV